MAAFSEFDPSFDPHQRRIVGKAQASVAHSGMTKLVDGLPWEVAVCE